MPPPKKFLAASASRSWKNVIVLIYYSRQINKWVGDDEKEHLRILVFIPTLSINVSSTWLVTNCYLWDSCSRNSLFMHMGSNGLVSEYTIQRGSRTQALQQAFLFHPAEWWSKVSVLRLNTFIFFIILVPSLPSLQTKNNLHSVWL